jgi:hypothetical protein
MNGKNPNIENIDFTVVKNALEFYDSNYEKYNNFLNKIEFLNIDVIPNSRSVISFLDSKKNVLLKSPFELLGVYLPKQKIWKWSWSIPVLPKYMTFISGKILEYSLGLETKDFFLKSKLTNSKINILNDLQLDINIAISSYVSKLPFIFKYFHIENNVELNDDYDETNNNSFKYVRKMNDTDDNYMIYYFFILNHNDLKS